MLRDCPFQKLGLIGLIVSVVAMDSSAQPLVINYDEAKVPGYRLSDPLVMSDGRPVHSASAWYGLRRPEILDQMTAQMYGEAPGRPEKMHFSVVSDQTDALGGLARRKEVTIHLKRHETDQGVDLNVLLYLPAKAKEVSPVFLGFNFFGNHSISHDPEITLSDAWMRNDSTKGIREHRATSASRGSNADRWPVQMMLERGYGLATAYYGDIDPDFDDGWQNGVHPMFFRESQRAPEPHQWGSVAAWAWGLSRIMDYLVTDVQVDHDRVAVMGHSRLGKAALWAGANDARFAIVVSNNSGCGGAALSKRAYGETVRRINTSFPHWFCGHFGTYNEREALLPFDQHQLIALIAPRPVYIASAVEDRWADPKGEFLSGLHADPVYRLLGKRGISGLEMPELNRSVGNAIGYHVRDGRHNVLPFDWKCYMDFADRHLR